MQTEMLLDHANGGDHDAWREIYRRYRPFLILCIDDRVGMRLEDPDDVLQSAFLSAWKDIRKFQYQGTGSLRAWLRKIVVNKNLSKLGKLRGLNQAGAQKQLKTGWLESLCDEGGVDPAESTQHQESHRFLIEHMERLLEPIEQEILVLKVLERLTTAQVAEIVEMSESSVKNKYRCAMECLARAMGNEESTE